MKKNFSTVVSSAIDQMKEFSRLGMYFFGFAPSVISALNEEYGSTFMIEDSGTLMIVERVHGLMYAAKEVKDERGIVYCPKYTTQGNTAGNGGDQKQQAN